MTRQQYNNMPTALAVAPVRRPLGNATEYAAAGCEEANNCSEQITITKQYNPLSIFTALHGMQTRSGDEKAVRLSVCLSNA